jgi:hypothetical protein
MSQASGLRGYPNGGIAPFRVTVHGWWEAGVLSRRSVTLIAVAHATFWHGGADVMHFANYIVLGVLIACMLGAAGAVFSQRK